MNPKRTPETVEPERYELFEGPRYQFALDRRDFLKAVGGGILVALVVGDAFAQQAGHDEAAADDAEERPPVQFAVQRRNPVQLQQLGLEVQVVQQLLAHRAPPFIALAACSMAVTIRA